VLNVAKEKPGLLRPCARHQPGSGSTPAIFAQVDLDRLELQRVQYESDLQTAEVNLRTAKIQLLMLLNDRTPVEQLDVTGPFDFSDQIAPLDDFRKIAGGHAARSEGSDAGRR